MEQVFKENPHLKKVYVTSDGTPFYNENDANNHAKTLEDKTVEPVMNPNHLEVEAETETAEVEQQMQEFLTSQVINEPDTTEPDTTEPATTEPATTEPDTTEPATTEPATTEPATTEPATTEPATTEPEKPAKPLSQMNKAQLLEYAKLNSIAIADPEATNKELVKEIEAAQNKVQ